MMDEMTADEKAMYAALPPDQQQQFDRLLHQQELSAADLRHELARFESLCAAYATAVLRERSTGSTDELPNRQPLPQYAA